MSGELYRDGHTEIQPRGSHPVFNRADEFGGVTSEVLGSLSEGSAQEDEESTCQEGQARPPGFGAVAEGGSEQGDERDADGDLHGAEKPGIKEAGVAAVGLQEVDDGHGEVDQVEGCGHRQEEEFGVPLAHPGQEDGGGYDEGNDDDLNHWAGVRLVFGRLLFAGQWLRRGRRRTVAVRIPRRVVARWRGRRFALGSNRNPARSGGW